MGCCGCGEDENDPEAPQKGTNQQRSCTDVIWLALFIVFWLFMILIAAFALVYGSPTRLRNGYDSYGNTCGVKKNEKIGDIALSGLDTSDKPYLFYLDVKNLRQSLQICVKQCPDRNINTFHDLKSFMNRTGSSLCTYDFDLLNVTDEKLGIVGDSYTKALGPCPPLPVYYSGSVLHRCVPKPVKELASQVIGGLYGLINSWDTIEQVLSDIYETWDTILALCFLALVLSLFMVAILHFVASIVAYVFMIAVSIACVVGTSILWYTYAGIKWNLDNTPENELLEKSVRNERAILVYAILATIFTIILLLLVWAMRKRIGFLAQLFKESSECMIDMPYLFIQPFITFAVLVAFFAFWVTVIVCLSTATYPGSKSLTPLFEKPDNPNSLASSPYTTSSENLSPRIGNVSVKQLKTLKFVEFIDATWVRYMWWVYLIGLIWTSEFILACQQMVIAGAVAIWYFDGGRKSVGSPVLTSISNLVTYHLGSIALGSLLITALKIPRLILTYIYAKMKKNEEANECAKCGLKCCICCFYCLEKCVRFMNHNAYTVIAMQGINFCSAARRAFSVLVSNALQLATVNSVGDFILFLGKCFVTAVTASIGLLLLKRDVNLKFYAMPVLVIAIFAFFIAHCVLSLYEVVIDTLFLCMCEDQNMNGDAGNWKKSTVVELQQQAIAQRNERVAADGDTGHDETDRHTQNTVDEESDKPAELTPINEN